ncbi:MAG: toll/interleukin-1 receptor domain-containing protein [Acidimicrobiia bacterium]
MRDAVFISYRRAEHAAEAKLLRSVLAGQLTGIPVFRDIEGIEPGDHFGQVLQAQLERASVVLVLVGPQWLSMVDRNGSRLLDNPDDWVHRELSAALAEEDVIVVPLLFDGASMPTSAAQLPPPLVSLLDRQAVTVRVDHLERDLAPVIDVIRRRFPKTSEGRARGLHLLGRRGWWPMAVVFSVVAGVGVWTVASLARSEDPFGDDQCGGFSMEIAAAEATADGERVMLRLAAPSVGISVAAESNLLFSYANGVTKRPEGPTTWGDSFELADGQTVLKSVTAPVPGWDTVVLRGSDPLGPDTTECPVQASR